jgi:hypothetical protein
MNTTVEAVDKIRRCGQKTEIFSRVCGYHRPVKNWNKGKQEEFKERKLFSVDKARTKGVSNGTVKSEQPEV